MSQPDLESEIQDALYRLMILRNNDTVGHEWGGPYFKQLAAAEKKYVDLVRKRNELETP
jgi:uncharacterized protein (UPF0262 family)